jgi:hypothetical protein
MFEALCPHCGGRNELSEPRLYKCVKCGRIILPPEANRRIWFPRLRKIVRQVWGWLKAVTGEPVVRVSLSEAVLSGCPYCHHLISVTEKTEIEVEKLFSCPGCGQLFVVRCDWIKVQPGEERIGPIRVGALISHPFVEVQCHAGCRQMRWDTEENPITCRFLGWLRIYQQVVTYPVLIGDQLLAYIEEKRKRGYC